MKNSERAQKRRKNRVVKDVKIVKRKTVPVVLNGRKKSFAERSGKKFTQPSGGYLPTPTCTSKSGKRHVSGGNDDEPKHLLQKKPNAALLTPSCDTPPTKYIDRTLRDIDDSSTAFDDLGAFQIDGCGDSRLLDLSQLPLPPLYQRHVTSTALGKESELQYSATQQATPISSSQASQAEDHSDCTEYLYDDGVADAVFESFSGDRFDNTCIPSKPSDFEPGITPSANVSACLKIDANNMLVSAGVQKFYAVIKGRKPGVYFGDDWEDQVNGFAGAYYRRFTNLNEAVALYNGTIADCPCPICTSETCAKHIETTSFELCEEQQDLIDLILEGHNVFYTGAAGTGKSYVLRHFVEELEKKRKKVFKVAPTGLSALNMAGRTYYSFAGWTLHSKKKRLETLRSEATRGLRWTRLNEADVLVIDEISMIEADQFERLNQICQAARAATGDKKQDRNYHDVRQRSKHARDLPFGGIQIIVTGDFRQLPPVKPFSSCLVCGRQFRKHEPPHCFKCARDYTRSHPYAFCSDAWKQCSFKNVVLTQPHRQADPVFISILNHLRDGCQLQDDELDLLLDHDQDTEGGLNLFSTNVLTDSYNKLKLRKLETPARRFFCHDNFRWNETKHPDLYYYRGVALDGPPGSLASLQDHIFASDLTLKVGMPVMLTYNMDAGAGLINGSRGELVSFRPYDTENLTCADSKSRSYLPAAKGDHKHYRDERVRSWIKKADHKKWPVVRFENGICTPVYPVCQVEAHGDANDEDEYSLLSRTQLPLLPAWAVTIHKAQGLSLDKVIVHLDEAFDREQPYVALSRAKSLAGLRIVSRNRLAILRKGGKLAGNREEDAVGHFLEKMKCFQKPKATLS